MSLLTRPAQRRSLPVASRTCRRGFSLIEMVVVVGILVVVLAIVLPALSGARTAARKSATQSLMSNLQTATQTFTLDNKRLPGYFNMSDMASADNDTRGFSMMDNVMIDLAGGITQAARDTGNNQPCDLENGPRIIDVGPRPTALVKINLANFGGTTSTGGTSTKAYFPVDRKNTARQCIGGSKRAGTSAPLDHLAMPTLIDSFGQPILAWAQDDRIALNTEFARERESAGRARFYWNTNAAFLRATALGELGENQADLTKGSLLGVSGANANTTLQGLFGNPSAPDPTDATKALDSRGKMIYHSAGANGIYVGKKERGGKNAGVNGLAYQAGRDPVNDGSFDDIFLTTGN